MYDKGFMVSLFITKGELIMWEKLTNVIKAMTIESLVISALLFTGVALALVAIY